MQRFTTSQIYLLCFEIGNITLQAQEMLSHFHRIHCVTCNYTWKLLLHISRMFLWFGRKIIRPLLTISVLSPCPISPVHYVAVLTNDTGNDKIYGGRKPKWVIAYQWAYWISGCVLWKIRLHLFSLHYFKEDESSIQKCLIVNSRPP